MTRLRLALVIGCTLCLSACELLDPSCPSGHWRPVAGGECVPLPVSDAGFDAGGDGGAAHDAGGQADAGFDGSTPDGSLLDGSRDDAATRDGAVSGDGGDD